MLLKEEKSFLLNELKFSVIDKKVSNFFKFPEF